MNLPHGDIPLHKGIRGEDSADAIKVLLVDSKARLSPLPVGHDGDLPEADVARGDVGECRPPLIPCRQPRAPPQAERRPLRREGGVVKGQHGMRTGRVEPGHLVDVPNRMRCTAYVREYDILALDAEDDNFVLIVTVG